MQDINDTGELRRLLTPGDLEERFLEAAAVNTEQGIETCALLCGDVNSALVTVTHLVVPKQTGTNNTVEMTSDASHDTFLIESGLKVLGWIHTHPTQTAFLSSVDLHTQLSYQMLLPEAVAVVCAPLYGVNKWLRLTPEGMKLVEGCTFRGFHEHASKRRLFTQALGIEYVQTKTTVVDLRQVTDAATLMPSGPNDSPADRPKPTPTDKVQLPPTTSHPNRQADGPLCR